MQSPFIFLCALAIVAALHFFLSQAGRMPFVALFCSEVSLPKKAGVVISALICLYSELNAASCHLPFPYDTRFRHS